MSNIQQISKFNGTQNELLKIKVFIENGVENSQDETDIIVLANFLDKKEGFIERLFPKKETKVRYNSILNDNFHKYFKIKIHLIEIYSEIRLELIRKQSDELIDISRVVGNQLLAKNEIILKNELSLFCKNEVDEMSITLSKSRNDFMDMVSKQYSFIEHYKEYPDIRKSYKKMLLDETKLFFSTIDTLLNVFLVSIENKLNIEPVIIDISDEQIDKELLNKLMISIDDTSNSINTINKKILGITKKIKSTNFK